MQKLIEVNTAKEFANTFLADPILKMAVNAVLNNCPAAEEAEKPTAPIPPADPNTGLLPCPFCGGPAELAKARLLDGKSSYKVGFVRCKKCYSRSGEQSIDGYYGLRIYTDEEIRAEWNRRANHGDN